MKRSFREHLESGLLTAFSFAWVAEAFRLDAILAEFNENPGKYLERLELVDIF